MGAPDPMREKIINGMLDRQETRVRMEALKRVPKDVFPALYFRRVEIKATLTYPDQPDYTVARSILIPAY